MRIFEQPKTLLLTAVLLASLWPAATPAPGQSLDPSSPAKEFIYAGGRLVAVEITGSSAVPPIVTITAPADSSTLPAANVVLTYTATDDVSVARCELQIDTGTAWNYPTCVGTTVSYVHLDDTDKILAYDFAEGVIATAYDREQSENNDGTINGATSATSAYHGQALHFDGTNDYIEPASPNPGKLHDAFTAKTFETWFKAGNTSNRQTIFEEGGSSAGMYVGLLSNQIRFSMQEANGGPETLTTAFTDTTGWHHLAAVFDAGTMTLYLDGSSVATQTATFSSVASHGGGPGIAASNGSDPDDNTGGGFYFAGDLDEVAIYGDALTSTEVADHAANSYLTGAHTLKVTAYDDEANTGSDQVSITISASTTPSVTITAPADSSTFTSGDIDLTYNATDDVGVTKCEFQLDAGFAMEYTTCVGTTVSYIHLTDAGKFLAYDFAEGAIATSYDRAADAENNDGTVTGATAATSPNHGTALSFDGVNDWIEPASPNPGELHDAFTAKTFETWFKADNTSNRQTIFEEGGSSAGMYVGLLSNQIRFSMQEANGGPETLTTAFTDTTGWHHLAAVYDAGTMTLYLDGSSVATQSATFSSVAVHGGGPGIAASLGADADNNTSGGLYFAGDLDEIAIYSDALTSTEVADHAANDYLSTSAHTLKVTAYDVDTNTGSDQVSITIQ